MTYWIFQPATYQNIVLYCLIRLDVNSQEHKNTPSIWISGVEGVENKKVNLWNFKEWFNLSLTCLKSGVSHFSAMSLSVNRGWPSSFSGQLSTFWCEYGINQCFFPGLHWSPCNSLHFRLWFDNLKANCCQTWLSARARARYSAQFEFMQ